MNLFRGLCTEKVRSRCKYDKIDTISAYFFVSSESHWTRKTKMDVHSAFGRNDRLSMWKTRMSLAADWLQQTNNLNQTIVSQQNEKILLKLIINHIDA